MIHKIFGASFGIFFKYPPESGATFNSFYRYEVEVLLHFELNNIQTTPKCAVA